MANYTWGSGTSAKISGAVGGEGERREMGKGTLMPSRSDVCSLRASKQR